MDDHQSVIFMFDPMAPKRRSSSQLEEDLDDSTPSIVEKNNNSLPFPIKIHLKSTPYEEMRIFVDLIKRISKVQLDSSDQFLFCQRVQRLTSQHLERNRLLLVNISIFVQHRNEPFTLKNFSLQSTVSDVLYKLMEIYPFDYDEHLLKLRSKEEYLRNDDVLCDIQYVYDCLASLKPLQFVLVKRQCRISSRENRTFEEFCREQYSKIFTTNKILSPKST